MSVHTLSPHCLHLVFILEPENMEGGREGGREGGGKGRREDGGWRDRRWEGGKVGRNQ